MTADSNGVNHFIENSSIEYFQPAFASRLRTGRGDASRATEAHHSATTPPVEGPRNSFILQTLKASRP